MNNRIREEQLKEQILLLQQDITEKDTEILETDLVVMDLVEVPVTIAETMTGEEGGEDHPEMMKTPGVLTGGNTGGNIQWR